jgi:hypothetical protein
VEQAEGLPGRGGRARSRGWDWRVIVLTATLIVAVIVLGGPMMAALLNGPGTSAQPVVSGPATAALGTMTPSSIAAPSAVSSAAASAVASAGPTALSTARSTPFGSPSTVFDLRRTAWRLLDLPGHALDEETRPTIDFGLDPLSKGPATADSMAFGWNGCGHFTFQARLEGGRIDALVIERHDDVCGAIELRATFMARFWELTSWVVVGDFLILTGPLGHLEFVRELPVDRASSAGRGRRTARRRVAHRLGSWRQQASILRAALLRGSLAGDHRSEHVRVRRQRRLRARWFHPDRSWLRHRRGRRR